MSDKNSDYKHTQWDGIVCAGCPDETIRLCSLAHRSQKDGKKSPFSRNVCNRTTRGPVSVEKCKMSIGDGDNIYICGKPAKFETPKGLLGEPKIFVCGTHRRSVDNTHDRCGSLKRCVSLERCQKCKRLAPQQWENGKTGGTESEWIDKQIDWWEGRPEHMGCKECPYV